MKNQAVLFLLRGACELLTSNPLQCSWLENPKDRGAWWATVHGVAKIRTRLSDFTHSLKLLYGGTSLVVQW